MKKAGIIIAVVLCIAVCVIAVSYYYSSADAQNAVQSSPEISESPKNGLLSEDGSTYLYSDGMKLYGLQEFEGKQYYFDESGRMVRGLVEIGGYEFLFSEETGERILEPWDELSDRSSFLISVNKTQNVVTVFAKDGDKGYVIPIKVFTCSTGNSTPSGNFRIGGKWEWLCMIDNSYGQWISQISGNYLFHSVPYWGVRNAERLDVGEYNKLGTTCSHGCIRLRAGDAKWIYDNMPRGTKIVIMSSDDPGPLGKPEYEKLPDWHTWDPTDPNMAYKCREKGCH